MPYFIYVLLALITGMMLASTNAANAALARHIGVLPGTLVNYIAGLSMAAVCTTIAAAWRAPQFTGLPPLQTGFLLTGGFWGVLIIAATSTAMARISTVYVTVLLFVGQVLMGILLDAAGGTPLTWGKGAGCILIIAGLLYNLRLDRHAGKKNGHGQ